MTTRSDSQNDSAAPSTGSGPAGAGKAGSGPGLRQRAELETRSDLKGVEDLSFLSSEAKDHLLHELRVHQIELKIQNEELRRTQQEMEAARARYFDLYDLAPVGYVTVNEQGLILEANLTAATLLETTRDHLVNHPLNQFILPEDQDIYYKHRKQLTKTASAGPGPAPSTPSRKSDPAGKPQVCEIRMVGRDGQPFWARLGSAVSHDEINQGFQIRLTITDISALKRTEEALARKSQDWSSTFDAITDAVLLLDNRQTIRRCNRAFADFVGLSFKDIVGRKCHEVVHGTPGPREDCPFRNSFLSGHRQVSELGIGYRIFSATIDPILDGEGRPVGAVHILIDITARKRAEEALQKSEEHLRLLSRELAVRNGIRKVLLTIADESMYTRVLEIILDVMESPYGVFGFLDEEGNLVCPTLTVLVRDQCQVPDQTFVFSPDTWDDSSWLRALRDQQTIWENAVSTKNPRGQVPITRHISLPLIHRNQVIGLIQVANKERDYTREDIDLLETLGDVIAPVLSARLKAEREERERKKAQEDLIQAEEKYRSIVENAVEGIFQVTADGKFLMVNTAAMKFHGYDTKEEMIASITNIRDQLYVNPEDRDVYRRLLETQGTVKGFETRFFRKDGSIWWGSMNVRAVRDKIGKVLYFEGTIEDITVRKEAENARDQNLQQIRKSLEGTISTLALASEIRDPYTAGHQRRVSDLARSMAAAMGLPADQVDGLRMAGVIHDIGKIAIPAEILSTPRTLTVIEYGLIKTHPQAAFDILKEIEFPWPIAEIVLQHHERMDGSGYPQGLRGEEILIEARILAVADVMEAIASHRPYRPALGIEVALQEIEKHKGIHYDPEVVDCCLWLFRQQGYCFK